MKDFNDEDLTPGSVVYAACKQGDSVEMRRGLIVSVGNTARIAYIDKKSWRTTITCGNVSYSSNLVIYKKYKNLISCDDADFFNKKQPSTLPIKKISYEMLDWIEDNVECKWTLSKSVDFIAFEDTTVAVQFKLIWSNQ